MALARMAEEGVAGAMVVAVRTGKLLKDKLFRLLLRKASVRLLLRRCCCGCGCWSDAWLEVKTCAISLNRRSAVVSWSPLAPISVVEFSVMAALFMVRMSVVMVNVERKSGVREMSVASFVESDL